MAREFTDSNFQSDVLASDKLTVVDFWAEWCGPCRSIAPILNELAKEFQLIKVDPRKVEQLRETRKP